MTRPLPLAAARARLAKRPGRPPKSGPPPGTPGPPVPAGGGPTGRAGSSADTALAPRLLDVRAGAAYLGLSTTTFRTLVAAGAIPRIRVPTGAHRGELRKVLVDRQDLDRLVETWREDRP